MHGAKSKCWRLWSHWLRCKMRCVIWGILGQKESMIRNCHGLRIKVPPFNCFTEGEFLQHWGVLLFHISESSVKLCTLKISLRCQHLLINSPNEIEIRKIYFDPVLLQHRPHLRPYTWTNFPEQAQEQHCRHNANHLWLLTVDRCTTLCKVKKHKQCKKENSKNFL